MAWIEITEAQLKTVISGPELAAYRSAALADGQADPIQATIDQVTDLVRGYVGGCKANVLGNGNTIHEKLLAPALDILAVRIPRRVGRDPKRGRDDAHKQALELLRLVSRCEFDIEEPATATPELSASQNPKITSPTLKFDRTSQDGI